jgi:hypothetical protein
MGALEDRLRRFAYEWHEAMNSPYAVNMMPMLLEAASDVRSLAAPSLEAENAKLRKLVVLGIMLPLNEEQLNLLDKTFVSEFGEGLYVQLEKLGIEVDA